MKGKQRPVWRLVAWCCPALLWLAGRAGAPAQEALLSARALDRIEAQYQNAPGELKPGQPHLGPVQLLLGLYAAAEFNDNVNLAQTQPQRDVILRGGVSVGAVWPATERSALRLSGDIGYMHYLNHSAYDGLEIAPNSALTYGIDLRDGSVTFYDQLDYSRQVVNQGSLSALASLPRLDNTIGTRATWLPGHWLLEAGYSHDDFLAQAPEYAYLNRASEYFTGRGAWRFGENSQAGVEASGSLTAYQESIQQDNQSVSVGAFTEWQVTQAIHAELHAGPTWFLFDSSGGRAASQLGSYYYGLELTNQLTEFISQRVTVRRDVQLGYNQGTGYFEQLSAGYGLSWALTPRLGLSAFFTYEAGNQPLLIYIWEFTEHYERYGINPSIAWRFTENLALNLGYSHWMRQSDLPGREYAQNSVMLRLSYTF